MAKNFRLYIKEPLAPGKTIILEEEQTHYLKNVVKYTAGDTFSCFDNESGEFSARITAFEKRHTRINILCSNRTVHPLSGYLAAVCPPEKGQNRFCY